MTPKVLRPTTIIPPHLYIERDADRQLRSIVDEMGRPGYVLVARQMGKTNLLINMKRQRDAEGDVVLYFDLSNRADTLRSFFRNIIDTALEAKPEIFGALQQSIMEQRSATEVEPGIEFGRDLRQLLRAINRRFIIIFDEIDSLIGTAYSDKVFAQIRSMYFSRTTYPEYERLTYVLSGVAEPSDLIQDKSISPFNIGEKIYLDDFTEAEFLSFLKKAKLPVPSEIADQVYSWTGGNPRITWDLCSELEDFCAKGEAISRATVDDAVKKIYLTSFDRAPVDHIRTLVEHDAQIRDAIVSIKYGNGEALDDKVRNRLYLAGIISLNHQFRPLRIKNRVIESSLSDKWIEDLAKSRRNLLVLGSESYTAGDYQVAISHYEQFLELCDPGESLPLVNQLDLAMARFQTRDYEGAVREFEKCREKAPEDSRIDDSISYYIGTARLLQDRYLESIAELQKVAEDSRSAFYFRALQNLGTAYLRIDARKFTNEVLAFTRRIIEGVENLGERAKADDREALLSAVYNTARVYQARGDNASATEKLRYGLSKAGENRRIAFQLFSVELEVDLDIRRNLLKEIVDEIIGKKLIPAETSSFSSLEFTRLLLGQTLSFLDQCGMALDVERLLSYVLSNEPNKAAAVLVYSLWETLREQNVERAHGSLLRLASSLLNGGEAHDVTVKIIRDGALYSARQQDEFEKKYLELLEGGFVSGNVEDEDFLVLATILRRVIERKEYAQGKRIALVARNLVGEERRDVSPMYPFVLIQVLGLHQLTKDIKSAKEVAQEILKLTSEDLQKGRWKEFTEVMATIQRAARNFLAQFHDPFRRIGRNVRVRVRYEDGLVTERKFKLVEEDLRIGKCALVD